MTTIAISIEFRWKQLFHFWLCTQMILFHIIPSCVTHVVQNACGRASVEFIKYLDSILKFRKNLNLKQCYCWLPRTYHIHSFDNGNEWKNKNCLNGLIARRTKQLVRNPNRIRNGWNANYRPYELFYSAQVILIALHAVPWTIWWNIFLTILKIKTLLCLPTKRNDFEISLFRFTRIKMRLKAYFAGIH